MAKFCYCARVLVSLSVSLMLGNGYIVESGAVAICKPPLIPGPDGKYCYDFQPNPGKLSWIGAQDFCLEKGGKLATLRTLKEVDFITRKMSEHHLDSAYLGFRTVMNSTNWRWVGDNTKIDPAIADWASGEPNYKGEQNCGSAFIKGYGVYAKAVLSRKILFDDYCDKAQQIGFICKIPPGLRNAKSRNTPGIRNGETLGPGHGDEEDGGEEEDDDIVNDDEEDMDSWP